MTRWIAACAVLLATSSATAANLGSWAIDQALTFSANTHAVNTGEAADADSAPTYRVYEDETGTAILSGSMATLDDANTTGFYSEQLTLSAANGFEFGKSYTVYIAATVGGTTGSTSHNFQIGAAANVTHFSGAAGTFAGGRAEVDLNSDANAEPTGAPSSTATLAEKIAYLYMMLTNKVTVTAAAKTYHDAAGNAEFAKPLADNGTTYTESAAQ